MTTAEIDFEELFDAAPNPYLVLDADLVIRYANRAYLQVTGRTRDELAGQYILEAFPDTPAAPDAARDFGASLQRVLDSREPDVVAPKRFDIPVADRPGELEERWWCGMSSPVLGPDGTVKWIIARADDVTEFMHSPVIRELTPPLSTQATRIAAQVYARSHDLELLNEQLRHAHAREREIAVALQEVMLRSPTWPGTGTSPCATCRPSDHSTCAATGTTWSICRPTATPSLSGTLSATVLRPPPSWACCAAP